LVAGPATRLPPSASTRSRIPRSPLPTPKAGEVPLSVTTSVSSPSAGSNSTTTVSASLACRMVFVNDSCTIRYAVKLTCAGTSPGIPRWRTVSPAAVAASTSSGSRSRSATGDRSCDRTTPRVARRSANATRLASLIANNASLAWSGRLSAMCAPTPACTLIMARLCATTS
jgi:hypothetical protein